LAAREPSWWDTETESSLGGGGNVVGICGGVLDLFFVVLEEVAFDEVDCELVDLRIAVGLEALYRVAQAALRIIDEDGAVMKEDC